MDAVINNSNWQQELERTYRGEIKNCANNAKLIIANDPELKGIVYDELANAYTLQSSTPWRKYTGEWRDQDLSQLTCYLDKHYCSFSVNNIYNGFVAAIDDKKFHPIKTYLGTIELWDAVNRVDTLLIDWLGAPDNEYVRMATRLTLTAAIKRILHPGTKFDSILVLNGPQGIGKSTLLSKLGMQWFSDSLSISDMNDKTAAEKIQGNWIMEISEMAGIKKADTEKVKAFISRQDDKYRASYAKTVTSHPRQCVFFGTTNSTTGFLRDITGNRRFWTIDVAGNELRHPYTMDQSTVDQIWAEAILFAECDIDLILTGKAYELSQLAQNKSIEYDEREGMIREYLDKPIPANWGTWDIFEKQSYLSGNSADSQYSNLVVRNHVCNMEIWTECLGQNENKLSKHESYQINAIMKRIEGWEDKGTYKRCGNFGNQRVHIRAAQEAQDK